MVLCGGSPQVVPRGVGTEVKTTWLAGKMLPVLTESGPAGRLR